MSIININQFAQTPIQGDADLQIASSFTITGILSATQVSSLNAGTPVKLDATVTSGQLPQFVAAAAGDRAFGFIKRTAKQSVFATGDKVEVMSLFGPVMWLTASGSIACGALVESTSDGSAVQTKASGALRGIMLDPVADGQLGRVLITDVSSIA
jgi:hypothetical protein